MDFDAIIVGAGPVGSTLAWQLIKAGFSVGLLDAESAVVDQLRASTFHPPTLDMLAADGISDELHAAGRITPTWQIRMHSNDERAEFDLQVLSADTDYPYRLQCRQAVLVNSCLSRINRTQPGAMRLGAQVTAVSQGKTDVQVQFKQAGTLQTVTARWLIGCDGARSIVRESLGIGFDGDAYPEHTILATTRFPFEEHLDGLSGVNYIWGDSSTFSLLRLPDVWRCSFHPREGQSPEQAMQTHSIQEHLVAVTPAASGWAIDERRIYKVHHRIARRYRQGRIFLAGDAAHLNSPKGGMGMNGGIHDAFELADILTQVGAAEVDSTSAALLDRYERRRRPVAENDIIGQADQNRARMAEKNRAARLARLHELQAIAARPDKARQFLLRSSMIDGLRKSQAVL
ncbi:MAG: NAD(P)/FAD-dependent oxidoreductase [Burkholderiaceae bacterium]